VINNNVRRRKAEDKMAMIFVAIVSGENTFNARLK